MLLPRHPLVVMLVLVTTTTIAYTLKSAPPTYLETATVVFSPPATLANGDSDAAVLTSGQVMAETVTSPASQNAIRAAGGTAEYSLTLLDLGNQEYPIYRYPFATLSVQSTSAKAVDRTFSAALNLLKQILANRQRRADAPRRSWLAMDVIGATGPTIQPGSLKRSFAALALLAAIVIGITSSFLNRHRTRMASLLPWRPLRRTSPVIGDSHSIDPITLASATMSGTPAHSARHRASRGRR